MPYKAGKLCGHPGCPNVTHRKYCAVHEKQNARTSTTKQGYGYRWQQRSKVYLKRNPLCVNCGRNSSLTPASVVDHITPHRGDQKLFWDESNWQSLCKSCHDTKTATEDGGFGKNREYRY